MCIRDRPRRAGLGQSARPVPPFRRCAATRTAVAGRFAAGRIRVRAPGRAASTVSVGAGFAGDLIRAVAGTVGLEAARRVALGAALQPIERQPASDRRLSDLPHPPRLGGRRPSLPESRSRSGAARRTGFNKLGQRPAWRRGGGPNRHPLAGNLEIRLAGLPLLPARLRPRHRRHQLRRCRARLAGARAGQLGR